MASLWLEGQKALSVLRVLRVDAWMRAEALQPFDLQRVFLHRRCDCSHLFLEDAVTY